MKNLQREQSKLHFGKIESLLSESPVAGAGDRFTVMGYNEFVYEGKAEREYWVFLNPGGPTTPYAASTSSPLCITPGQILMHANHDEISGLEWCVLHLQYSSWEPLHSTVQ